MNNTLTLADIIRHTRQIQAILFRLAFKLSMRGILHDQSKFRPDELAGFVEINEVARTQSFMSGKYKQTLNHPALALHYNRNSHHPEHSPDGLASMTLIDLIEMVADWRAAFLVRRESGVESMEWADSLQVQRRRFNMNDEQFNLIVLVSDFICDE